MAFAAGIVTSKHNLSTTGSGVHSTTQTQICIFCHSPHSGMGGTLWNRLPPDVDPATYTLYNSSNTLSPAAKAGKINSASRSMLCMTCHGGTVEEIGAHVVNKAGDPMTMVDTNGTWTTSGVLWDGKSPVNHPIGFSYSLAQSQDSANLRPIAQVNATLGGSGSIFFSSNATGTIYQDSMECATCHMVHDPANSAFLRIDNTGNALCLACHITTSHPIPVEAKTCTNCHNPHGQIARGAKRNPPPPFSNITTSTSGTLKFAFTTTDPATGANSALLRAFTYLRNATKPPPMERFFTRADYIFAPSSSADGSYTITGVPSGSYFIRINQRADAAQQTSNGALGPPSLGDLTWMQTAPITISTGQTLDLGTLNAYPFASAPITITGTVRSLNGVPLAGRYVRAQTEPCMNDGWNDKINQCGPDKNLALQPTDANGKYTILLRDPGAYYIYTSPCISAESYDYSGNVCSYTAAPTNPVAVKLRETKTVDLNVRVY
jgi:predicted CXXCH cytochrome family protein